MRALCSRACLNSTASESVPSIPARPIERSVESIDAWLLIWSEALLFTFERLVEPLEPPDFLFATISSTTPTAPWLLVIRQLRRRYRQRQWEVYTWGQMIACQSGMCPIPALPTDPLPPAIEGRYSGSVDNARLVSQKRSVTQWMCAGSILIWRTHGILSLSMTMDAGVRPKPAHAETRTTVFQALRRLLV